MLSLILKKAQIKTLVYKDIYKLDTHNVQLFANIGALNDFRRHFKETVYPFSNWLNINVSPLTIRICISAVHS